MRIRVVAYAAIFAAVQIYWVLTGWSDRGFICDDAFYYFQISRHAAMGQGFTFDGINPTNGFHPLLAWLSVPVFYFFGRTPWIPIRLILVGLAIAAATSGYLLFVLGRSAGAPKAGELMAGMFFLSPYAWILPLRGCEGALSILLVLASAVMLVKWRSESHRQLDDLLLGALLGLSFLARTENALWCVCVLVFLLVRKISVRRVLLCVGAATVVASPWLIWNLLRFHTLVQVSAAAKKIIDLYGRLPRVTGLSSALHNLYGPFEHTAQFVVGEEWSTPKLALRLVAASSILLFGIVLASRRLRSPSLLYPMYGFAMLHLCAYAWWLRAYYNWYFLPLVVVGAVLQGERLADVNRWLKTAALLASAVICGWTLKVFLRTYPHAPGYPEAWASNYVAPMKDIPAGARVGVWNAGRVSYFAEYRYPGIHIVNLDCVVNNEALDWYRDGRYYDYLLHRIEWLGEAPGYLFKYIGVPAAREFTQKHIVSLRGSTTAFRVISDPATFPIPDRPKGARVLFDFEDARFAGWKVEGTAFSAATSRGPAPNQSLVVGFRGCCMANSFTDRGDGARGALTSPRFVIDAPRLGFIVGGGRDLPSEYVALLVDGAVVRKSAGENSEWMRPVEWDVRSFLGRTATIRIVDDATGAWGHIMADDFYLAP